jgi:indolepyruvate ferredoxin oxidoreductase
MNVAAFRWGRRAVVDPAGVQALLVPPEAEDPAQRISRSFDEMVARRVEFLTAYQDATYAARYREWVHQAKAIEAAKAPGKCGLADAVGRYLFKLMAYKDEYEVARLYADPAFLKQVYGTFDGDRLRLRFHLAPPLLTLRNKSTGLPRKMTFGPWMLGVFKLLARVKFLRGSLFDPFGHTRERRSERKLISDYEAMLETLLAKLTAENHHIAVGLASVPEKIRGYGHVKMRHLEAAKSEEAALLEQFGASPSPVLKAAE